MHCSHNSWTARSQSQFFKAGRRADLHKAGLHELCVRCEAMEPMLCDLWVRNFVSAGLLLRVDAHVNMRIDMRIGICADA